MSLGIVWVVWRIEYIIIASILVDGFCRYTYYYRFIKFKIVKYNLVIIITYLITITITKNRKSFKNTNFEQKKYQKCLMGCKVNFFRIFIIYFTYVYWNYYYLQLHIIKLGTHVCNSYCTLRFSGYTFCARVGTHYFRLWSQWHHWVKHGAAKQL